MKHKSLTFTLIACAILTGGCNSGKSEVSKAIPELKFAIDDLSPVGQKFYQYRPRPTDYISEKRFRELLKEEAKFVAVDPESEQGSSAGTTILVWSYYYYPAMIEYSKSSDLDESARTLVVNKLSFVPHKDIVTRLLEMIEENTGYSAVSAARMLEKPLKSIKPELIDKARIKAILANRDAPPEVKRLLLKSLKNSGLKL